MRLESRVHHEGNLVRFEIVDLSDTSPIAGEDIEVHESLYLSQAYAREDTAQRNANKWIAKFKAATDAVRRKLCGYDSEADCRHTPRSVPVLRSTRP